MWCVYVQMNSEQRLKAISICIHYWIREENKIRVQQAIALVISKMEISIQFDNLYTQMFDKVNNYDLFNACKIRLNLVSLANKLVDDNIKSLCYVCGEHLICYYKFIEGYNDPFIEDFDHRLFSNCNKCQIQAIKYF